MNADTLTNVHEALSRPAQARTLRVSRSWSEAAPELGATKPTRISDLQRQPADSPLWSLRSLR